MTDPRPARAYAEHLRTRRLGPMHHAASTIEELLAALKARDRRIARADEDFAAIARMAHDLRLDAIKNLALNARERLERPWATAAERDLT